MKKKILLVVVSLALVTTLAVNGTFAQELRDAFNNIVDTLVGFVGDTVTANEAELKVELVFSPNTPTILAPSHYTDDNVWNEFVIVDGRKVWNSTKITGAVDKFVAVQNESREEAVYFRLAIAVRNDDVAKRVLRVNLNTVGVSGGYKYDGPYNIEIKKVPYIMHVFTYSNALPKGAITDEITMQAALTKETNNQDIRDLGTEFLQVKVVAIEADAFVENGVQLDAIPALNQAVPLDNFNPFE